MKLFRVLLLPIGVGLGLLVLNCFGVSLAGEIRPFLFLATVVAVAADFLSQRRELQVHARELATDRAHRRSPCASLRSLCDLLPSPLLRKRLTKLLADQERHIEKLLRQRRWRVAAWIRIATWAWFLWYVASGIAVALIEPLSRRRSE